MDTTVIARLHAEERLLLAELRASMPFRRLEEIQRLLALYSAQPPIGAGLDAMLAEREGGRGPRHAVATGVIALHGERASA
jgi:hypothetical protein